MTTRKERLQQLRETVSKLDQQRNEALTEIKKLDLEQKREEYPCSCVKLNGDVEIYDMQEQERRGRNPLSVGGFVMDTLTARKDCTTCNGTGVPGKKK